VPTTPGQTSDQVAADIAAAIEADPTLDAAGVTAFASGDRVVTTGTIDSAVSGDAGLVLGSAPPLPVFASWTGWLLVIGLILMIGVLGLLRGGAPQRA
jgi:hypothetical protein